MKERAKLLNGELDIVTRKNRGTEVMLDFPTG
jgi:signal transduction histidine kinase